MTRLGVGIIGSGFMGRTYTETISKYCLEAEIKAVTGGSRAPALAADYKIEHEATVESLLARGDVSTVFITTPHALHAPQALAAAAAGKHMMLEKPMACSVEDCDAIIKACHENNLCCTVAFTQRYRKCNIKAKALIDSGSLGRVYQIMEWQFLPGGLQSFPKWQSQNDNLGILFGHAIHNFDRIRWFSGAEIASVYAKCTNVEADSEVEGTSMLLMTLTDGTTVSLWSSGQMPKPGFPRTGFSAWIVGEKGLIDLDAFGELRATRDGKWHVVETQEPVDWEGKGFLDRVRLESFTNHCHDFFTAINTGGTPPITAHDGRQAVAAALAAYESSKTGKEILLQP
ncbi:MAG: Gfo/Idh/MocA family oxidoreductase [Pirellulales bacterium]|nr:Gfo/Idh/MocA family oxidoreductase [Pirellulales bacterium]